MRLGEWRNAALADRGRRAALANCQGQQQGAIPQAAARAAPPRGRWWLTCTVRGMRPSVCAWGEGAQRNISRCTRYYVRQWQPPHAAANIAGQDQQSSAAHLDAWRDDEVQGADPLRMKWADKRHVRMGRHVPQCLAAAAGVRTAFAQPHTHVHTHGQRAIRSSTGRSHCPPVWRACSGRAAARPAAAGAGRSAQTAGPAPTLPAPAAGQRKQRCWSFLVHCHMHGLTWKPRLTTSHNSKSPASQPLTSLLDPTSLPFTVPSKLDPNPVPPHRLQVQQQLAAALHRITDVARLVLLAHCSCAVVSAAADQTTFRGLSSWGTMAMPWQWAAQRQPALTVEQEHSSRRKHVYTCSSHQAHA